MFRKLYWVTEHVFPNGESRVLGVYTSIPDLIKHGLTTAIGSHLRLTLTKLDSSQEPLGCWLEPDFSGLQEQLEEYIRTEEFSREQCANLCNALRAVESHATAA